MDLSPFQLTTAVTRTSAGVYEARIAPGWEQGRGAFGGVVMAVLLRAIEAEETDGARRTRALAGDICGPVQPGPVTITVRTLRRGKNQTNYVAELSQTNADGRGETLALATAMTSSARAVALPPVPPPPPPAGRPARDALASVPKVPVGPPMGPVFGPNYEYRSEGPFPFTGGTEAVSRGWLRERVPPSVVGGPELVGMLDAWWPALLAVEPAPRPTATVGFTAQILVDPKTLPPDELLYFRARVEGHGDGFFVEMRELWRDDVLVAMNQQTFVVIR